MNYLYIIIVLLAILAVYAYIEAKSIRVKEYIFESDRIPESFDGFKLAFLSDIHCGAFVGKRELAELCEKTNDLDCDVILLGGDYVVKHTDTAEFYDNMFLKAPYGVIGIYGNHDSNSGKTDAERKFKSKGWTFLKNSGLYINKENDKIYICGLDDLMNGTCDMEKALNGRENGVFTITLCHNPDYADKVNSVQTDVMLSGHTHGGQITLLGLTPFIPKETKFKYLSGRKDNGRFTVITSNGTGTIYLPMRLSAPPQIVVLKLKSKRL